MPSKYDEQTRANAVRLVSEHRGDYASEWAAITTVAGRLGMTAETLRLWVRQAAVDAGEAGGKTSESAREIRELKRKNVEFERTIEILKAGGCRTDDRVVRFQLLSGWWIGVRRGRSDER